MQGLNILGKNPLQNKFHYAITGKTAVTGNNVSHSVRRTKRRFNPNLKTKRFWLEEEGRWITLKVTAAGITTINKKGLSAALREAKAPKNVY